MNEPEQCAQLKHCMLLTGRCVIDTPTYQDVLSEQSWQAECDYMLITLVLYFYKNIDIHAVAFLLIIIINACH